MQRTYILIMSNEEDIHARAVKRQIDTLSSGKISPIIFNTAAFPTKAEIKIDPEGWELKISSELIITNKNLISIWWRRPSRHTIDDRIIDSGAKKFSENEATHAFDSLVYWHDEYLVINRAESELIANRKTIQLSTANRLGFKIPRTLITNSPDDAISFIDSINSGAIYKTLTAPISTFGETRRFKPSLKEMASTISLAPIILQEEIARKRDIRVTVIGNQIFSTWIEIRNPAGRAFPDWRLDVTAKAHTMELPDDLKSKIRDLMKQLDLQYAAIDFIEDFDGEFHFLEVNPSGQFLFNEVDTGEEMSLAFAKLLMRN